MEAHRSDLFVCGQTKGCRRATGFTLQWVRIRDAF